MKVAAVLALALAGCTGLEPRADVAALVEQVSEAELRRHVAALATDIGPRPPHADASTEATVAYLVRELTSLGYEVLEEPYPARYARVRQRTEPDGSIVVSLHEPRDVRRVNVIAERPGTTEPEAVLELGAHYDTVFLSPGADDNTSGVAAVLEAARILRDVRCRRTIRFVFFGSEEYGKTGSRQHVENLSAEERLHYLGLLNLDAVGFASDEKGSQVELVPWWYPIPGLGKVGDFVLVVGNPRSAGLGNHFEDAVDAYAPSLPYYSANRIGSRFADAYRSDHANYWEADLPAVFLTGTGEFRNPNYHLRGDTADTLDYAFLREVARAAIATALHLAELE